MTPVRPRTTGKLKQHPNSDWKWLIGRTLRLSCRIEEQILETTDPIPSGVASLAPTMLRARFRHSRARLALSTSADADGRALSSGTPPIVAVDQTATCVSPWMPRTYKSIELCAIYDPHLSIVVDVILD